MRGSHGCFLSAADASKEDPDCATLPVRDARSAEEIIGYDDRGLPR